MEYRDYMALVEGVELKRQNDLAIQRHFIYAILKSQGAKSLHPKDILHLSLIDKTDKDKAEGMVNRLLEKELKRANNGRVAT
jgi:hypothetical protein